MKLILEPDEIAALAKALERWGEVSQVGQAIEECGELLAVLNQHYRGRATADQVAEEVADVMINMAQLARMIGEERVQYYLDAKMRVLFALLEQ